MKIEITEDEIKLNVDGRMVRFSQGDVVTVTPEIGNRCLQHGWAKDAEGNLPAGERVPGANGPMGGAAGSAGEPLKPANVTHPAGG